MKRRKRPKHRNSATSGNVGEKLRAAIRSIIRDWNHLSEPLPVDESRATPNSGAQRYRVRGASSYEELQEQVLGFAGRVWQLKDGLINWLQTQPNLTIKFSDANTSSTLVGTGGQGSKQLIEEAAKLCLPLLLCADLYNTHKHYTDCDRSGYQPFLSGVRFDTSNSGLCGIQYDGARKSGDITVATPNPVKFRIEIHSRNRPVNFGDAVVIIARAFKHWIPLLRQMELLSQCDREDHAILEDLATVDKAIDNLSPFDTSNGAIVMKDLPLEQRRMAKETPAEFIRKIKGGNDAAADE